MAQWEKTIEHLAQRLEDVGRILRIDALRQEVKGLDLDMEQPEFWNHQERARDISQKAAALKEEIDGFDALKDELRETGEVAQMAAEEGDTTVMEEMEASLLHFEDRLNALEFKTLFSGKHDALNAIVSIHAGAGGTDAQDWAEILMRMYMRFAEAQNWKVEVLDQALGDSAGLKRMTFAVRGRYAFGHFKGEAGVHRLVRISPFDAEKMRHTSFALVEVIPELDDLTEKAIVFHDKDLRIDTYASSGAGGQSVNTTNSAVRVTHIPTNTVVAIQNERSQQQNKETALRILKSRLFQLLLEEQKERLDELKGGHKAPEWGNQIRSYVLHPYKMVKDHRTGEETVEAERVLDGQLMPFIEAYLKQAAGG